MRGDTVASWRAGSARVLHGDMQVSRAAAKPSDGLPPVSSGARRSTPRNDPRHLVFLLLLASLTGCHWFRASADGAAIAKAAPLTSAVADFESISPDWISPASTDPQLDSVAAWTAPDGAQWLIASGSGGLRALDAETGALRRAFGGAGDRPGQFAHPAGLAVIDNMLLVVERDNHRVQVLRLPDLLPLATFGEADLRRPYGIWARPLGEGEYEVLVTDNYMSDFDSALPPALPLLDRRVKRFHVEADGAFVAARLEQAFGDTRAGGALHQVGAIAGDPGNGRLLIAEADAQAGAAVRLYSFAGDYSGRDLGFGLLHTRAAGIALWACADGSGYWIVADPFADRSVFHVFDRKTLAHRGAFSSKRIAGSGGIWLRQGASTAFPDGVLFALNEGRTVAAIAWPRIAIELNLRRQCG